MVIFLLFWGILGVVLTLISYIFDKKNMHNYNYSNRTYFIMLFFAVSWISAALYWVGPFFISIFSQKLM